MTTYMDDLLQGTVLQNRYVIGQRVGSGGMGTVYQAQDNRIAGRIVAIKEMKQANLSSEELERARKLFNREAAILSLVHHEHLPRIYDRFEEQDRYYLVMEFIEGKTLLTLLNQSRRPLPTLDVLSYAIQLCDVLIHLHSRFDPIIFRDLKPSNIMIQANGYVYLIDFGIARYFKEGQTSDTEAFGAPGYVAPEISYAQSDARADLFSLGVTMHHCLTQQVPDYFKQNRPFPPVRSYNTEVPKDLNTLILQMVEYNPNNRPQSATQVKQQLELIYQQVAASQGIYEHTLPGALPPAFYSDETEPASFPIPNPRPPAPPPTPPLVTLPALLWKGLTWLLLLLLIGARQVSKVLLSARMRQAIYDQYLHIRVRLNATGLWTDRFLLLLLGLFIGAITLSVVIYTHSGGSYPRAEFGLTFVLLVITIISAGRLRNAVARHILLCVASLVVVAFLALLASPDFQTASDSTHQPATFNLLLTYGLVTLTLIALLGSITTMTARGSAVQPTARVVSPASSGFVRLGHLALAGTAGLCFLLQLVFGGQEQVFLAPATLHPFALVFSAAPPVTSNVIPLVVLGFIALYEIRRYPQPFIGRDRMMLFILCLAFILAQYTFGLNELRHVFPGASTASLVILNLLVFGLPLFFALLALFPLPDQLAGIGLLPALILTLGVAWLQGYLGDQEAATLFSSNWYEMGNSFANLTGLGQVIFFCLAVAAAMLLFNIIFSRYRSSQAWANTTTRQPKRIPGAADRFALLVVTLGCGLVQVSFWQGALQHRLALDYAAQGTTLLYAAYLSLVAGYIAVAMTLLAAVLTTINTLFQLSQAHSWIENLVLVLDRLTVLCIAAIMILLCGFFGGRGGLLAASYNLMSISPSGPNFSFTFNVAFTVLLALFALISFIRLFALFRLKRSFGRVEQIVILLSGIGALLILTNESDVQQLPLLAADMQQVAGSISTSLSIDRVVAFCILLAALLSFFWLWRTRILSDRLILALISGITAFCALIDTLTTHHILLALALLAMMQGVLIAAKIERVRQGNTTAPVS